MRLATRTKIIVLFALAVVCASAAWLPLRRQPSPDRFDGAQNTLLPETKKVLDAGRRFVLLSLDPTDPTERRETTSPSGEMFHDYAVLGKTEIRDEKERTDLLRALYKGIAESEPGVANCFDPRHGISVMLGSETVDLRICFECRTVKTYAKTGQIVSTSRTPQATFNRSLEKARLPIAKNPSP